jgi:2-oxoglutarate ferredoxin oxidoreductase subunit beta
MVTKAQPWGSHSRPFNPVATAVANKIGFVARGFSGEVEHLAGLIQEALAHRGLSLVDILQPCVSFNKVNTFAWYKERVRPIGEDHDPYDWHAALKVSDIWGEEIPLGVIYKNDREAFDNFLPLTQRGPLVKQPVDMDRLTKIIGEMA